MHKRKMFGKGKQIKKHEIGDTMWLHRSKGDLLESRGFNRKDIRKFPYGKDEIIECQFYGKKIFLDYKKMCDAIDEKKLKII